MQRVDELLRHLLCFILTGTCSELALLLLQHTFLQNTWWRCDGRLLCKLHPKGSDLQGSCFSFWRHLWRKLIITVVVLKLIHTEICWQANSESTVNFSGFTLVTVWVAVGGIPSLFSLNMVGCASNAKCPVLLLLVLYSKQWLHYMWACLDRFCNCGVISAPQITMMMMMMKSQWRHSCFLPWGEEDL